VTGIVLDSVSGAAVDRGFVVLLDSLDKEVDRTQTDGAGRFLLEAPTGGRFRLKSLRVGYRTWTSTEFLLDRGQTLDYLMRVTALPIQLAAIEATEEDRCDIDPSEGSSTAALWEEVEKALGAAAWSANRRQYRYALLLDSRDSDIRGRRTSPARQTQQTGVYTTPFLSRSAEQLSRTGYIQRHADGTDSYFAPDADVLLSDVFLQDHCFFITRDPDSHVGQIGLAFRPVEGNEVADVTGTLWLDETASELRSLEYRYTGLPRSIRDERIGGRLEFMRLPTDAWIVRSWNIRMPLISAYNYMDRGQDSVLAGFRDIGGEVTRLAERDGTIVFEADYATLVGSVIDTSAGRPLQGARVTLEGTGDTVTSRWDGSFFITGEYNGDFEVRLMLSGSAIPTYVDSSTSVSMAPGQTSQLTFFVPYAAGVTGRVIDSETGAAIAGVEITEVGTNRRTVSDEMGDFELSELSPGVVQLTLRHVGHHQQSIQLELRRGQMLQLPPEVPQMAPLDVALLEPVVIEGERIEVRELRLRQFYARREQGSGSFVTRDELEQWHPLYMTDILRRMRGVRVVPNPHYGSRDSRRFIVESSRTAERIWGGACPPLYFLDGVLIGDAGDNDIDVVLSTNNIEAIEAYSGPSQMPAAFNMPGSRCGVIAFWTR
jgi:hypothetical protein